MIRNRRKPRNANSVGPTQNAVSAANVDKFRPKVQRRVNLAFKNHFLFLSKSIIFHSVPKLHNFQNTVWKPNANAGN